VVPIGWDAGWRERGRVALIESAARRREGGGGGSGWVSDLRRRERRGVTPKWSDARRRREGGEGGVALVGERAAVKVGSGPLGWLCLGRRRERFGVWPPSRWFRTSGRSGRVFLATKKITECDISSHFGRESAKRQM
jgi:hypothetical protein